MMSYVHQYIVPAAYALLPEPLRTPQATALLLAIGLQESGFAKRQQVGGPAHSFFQFELGGVGGVLAHPKTKVPAESALALLCYPKASRIPVVCYEVITNNDVLAVVFARLLLFTLPQALPEREDWDGGWQQYVDAWRPGKPRPETWAAHYQAAWAVVQP